MSELYDAPNQQAVRPDGSGPWEEGEGGGEAEAGELDSLTKAELLVLAEEQGVEVPAGATKAEIQAALEEG